LRNTSLTLMSQKEHLETQSRNILSRLYEKPASCLAIFRYVQSLSLRN